MRRRRAAGSPQQSPAARRAAIGRRGTRPPACSECPSRFGGSGSARLTRIASRDCSVPWIVSRPGLCIRQCCDGECMCDARTVIEAWWITLIRSPCTKARAGNTAVAGTAGSIRTLRSSNGVRGTARRRAASGRRILTTSRRESRGSGRSRISHRRRVATWPARAKAPRDPGRRSHRLRRARLTNGWKSPTTKHNQIQVSDAALNKIFLQFYWGVPPVICQIVRKGCTIF